jgi:hypothetical protein
MNKVNVHVFYKIIAIIKNINVYVYQHIYKNNNVKQIYMNVYVFI